MAGNLPENQARGSLKRLYDRCMTWIAGPYGVWALFVIAFVESSFFPIPPDVFLIAMCIAAPTRAFKYAAVCSAGSVLGGAFGYVLGFWFMDSIGLQIIAWYGMDDKYLRVQELYQAYDIWAVGAAGFTPLPYKLFTITAGAFKLNFPTFVIVSLLSRSARFFLVAAFIWKFGKPVQRYIDKYFNVLSIVFMILLVGGFLLIKMVL
ncbi:MAG: YqaA family protein [Desulfocapsaceae bacterium]|jgi:membrane protein YqaA with SNARE-associated domain|nr:YqaA family protein [Desulfocapsaceae bacterium]